MLSSRADCPLAGLIGRVLGRPVALAQIGEPAVVPVHVTGRAPAARRKPAGHVCPALPHDPSPYGEQLAKPSGRFADLPPRRDLLYTITSDRSSPEGVHVSLSRIRRPPVRVPPARPDRLPPELLLCATIVGMLLARLFTPLSRTHLGWFALVMTALAFAAGVAFWPGVSNWFVDASAAHPVSAFSGLLVFDTFGLFFRLFLLPSSGCRSGCR